MIIVVHRGSCPLFVDGIATTAMKLNLRYNVAAGTVREEILVIWRGKEEKTTEQPRGTALEVVGERGRSKRKGRVPLMVQGPRWEKEEP